MATKKANDVIDDDVDDDQLKSKPSPSEDGQVNKQAAADLEKVTDFHDDNKDEMNEVSQESLGNLKAQAEQNKFTLKKEDIQTIVQELEVPRIIAERKLIQHQGNLHATIMDLIGFE